jgi:hypothetical protein
LGKNIIKPLLVRDYNTRTEGVALKDQMLHLVEWKKCLKWYVKLFNRLLSATTYIYLYGDYKTVSTNMATDSLKLRFQLVKGLVENMK